MNAQTRRKFLIRSVSALGVAIPIVYSCEGGGGAGGGPLGPSGAGVFTSTATTVTVIPQSVTLRKGGTQTFTASGGAGSYNWSVSNSALGSIDISSGTFTAGDTTGILAVNAVDDLGASGSGAVTIITPTIIVTPSKLTIPNSITVSGAVPTAAAPYTVTYSASGGESPYYFTISGLTGTTIVMDLTTGVLSVETIPATDESLTITVTDTYGDTGTTTLTVEA